MAITWTKLTLVALFGPLLTSVAACGLVHSCPVDTASYPPDPLHAYPGTMDTNKLVPDDPRVRKFSAMVRNKIYEYIVGEPEGTSPLDTIFLIHGFPDLTFGWRYQVPYLMFLGFRVVVPNMLGYAGTASPQDVREWSLKNMAADIKELAGSIVGHDKIIVGGHDWGGRVVWRVVLWHPELVKAAFSVGTPYFTPHHKDFVDLEHIISSGHLNQFRYQLHFRGSAVQDAIQGKDKIRLFLQGMYGGTDSNGELGFTIADGILFENLPKLRRPDSMTDDELDFYVKQFMRQEAPQLRGQLNWYRAAKFTWEEEPTLADQGTKLDMPILFIAATDDRALTPSLSAGMEQHIPKLTRGVVQSSHWALTEASADFNEQLGE